MQQIIYVYRFRFKECNGFQDTWSFSVPGGWDDPKGLDLKCMLRWSAGYLWLEVEISTIYKIFDQLVNIWKRGRRMETIPKHLPPRILPVFNIHLCQSHRSRECEPISCIFSCWYYSDRCCWCSIQLWILIQQLLLLYLPL